MSIENKTKILKMIIKPKITYGLTIWNTELPSNINDLQRLLNFYSRCCANAKWYIRNNQIHREPRMKTLREELDKTIKNTKEKISTHPNPTINNIVL